jgi:hypothetical protein
MEEVHMVSVEEWEIHTCSAGGIHGFHNGGGEVMVCQYRITTQTGTEGGIKWQVQVEEEVDEVECPVDVGLDPAVSAGARAVEQLPLTR